MTIDVKNMMYFIANQKFCFQLHERLSFCWRLWFYQPVPAGYVRSIMWDLSSCPEGHVPSVNKKGGNLEVVAFVSSSVSRLRGLMLVLFTSEV